jgi:hypothetical protein
MMGKHACSALSVSNSPAISPLRPPITSGGSGPNRLQLPPQFADQRLPLEPPNFRADRQVEP